MPLRPLRFVLLSCGFALSVAAAVSVPGAAQSPTLESYSRALALVEGALEGLGGPEAVAGGLEVSGTGTLDLSARLQGRHPDRPTPVPVQERLVLAGDRFAYETHGRVNPDADEWMRYVYDGAGRMLVADRLNGRAFWVPGDADAQRRYARAVPHVLLEDALRQRTTLRHLGARDGEEGVTVTLPTGEAVSLWFDPEGPRLRGVEYLLDLPVRGDTSVRWTYGDYAPVEGLGPYPTGYRIEIGGRLFKDVTYEAVRPGPTDPEAGFDGLDIPPPPDLPELPPAASGPAPPVRVDTLAPGVYLARSVRGGFHALFVEFDTFVVAIDAPAGYHEFQMIPAVDWAGEGVTSSSVGHRFLDAIRETVPGKPVRHVVLTHHHGDHAGGIRPFLAEGATVHVSPATVPVVEAAARAAVTLHPDEGGTGAAGPSVHVVEGRHVITDGVREVVVVDVGKNPHVEGMLVVYLPEADLLYQSDLFIPSGGGFPDRARVPVMRWFVDWLDQSGLSPRRIYAMHGVRATDEQLQQIRSLTGSG